ncbi:TfuA-like protein [Streptomyces sp. NPDC057966]|uniref:TfuA-like protein n=1 Tax=Streptomyces sp. NPDC057966 TaxID=3346292 RepID=UPI0036EE3CA8
MIHVFVGPTLPRSVPQLTEPGVRVCPPVRHGDLFAEQIPDGDTVVIIDGVYHQAPALRHKEILAAIDRGVRVIGAASIGALRAAELDRFGMLGVGAVYDAYARGEIVGDDEVAVGQAPDGDLNALTWPVVNLRHVLELAAAASVIDTERAARLLRALHSIYYPQRTMAAVRAVCRREGAAGFARWLSWQRAQDPDFGDIKRADALVALRTALDGHLPQEDFELPAGAWDSAYFLHWSNAFARERVGGLDLPTEDRVIYQQVFDPEFSRTWRAYLEHRSLEPAVGPGRPLARRLKDVIGRGGLSADRVFHPPVDLRDAFTVVFLLAGESAQDRLAVARYQAALAEARRARPGFSVAAVRGDLTRRLLLQVWKCPAEEFDAQASSRGLVCGARAIEAAKRLVPGLLEEIRELNEPEESDLIKRTEVAHGDR